MNSNIGKGHFLIYLHPVCSGAALPELAWLAIDTGDQGPAIVVVAAALMVVGKNMVVIRSAGSL